MHRQLMIEIIIPRSGCQLDQLYIQILSQQQDNWLLRGVFALALAFCQTNLDRT